MAFSGRAREPWPLDPPKAQAWVAQCLYIELARFAEPGTEVPTFLRWQSAQAGVPVPPLAQPLLAVNLDAGAHGTLGT